MIKRPFSSHLHNALNLQSSVFSLQLIENVANDISKAEGDVEENVIQKLKRNWTKSYLEIQGMEPSSKSISSENLNLLSSLPPPKRLRSLAGKPPLVLDETLHRTVGCKDIFVLREEIGDCASEDDENLPSHKTRFNSSYSTVPSVDEDVVYGSQISVDLTSYQRDNPNFICPSSNLARVVQIFKRKVGKIRTLQTFVKIRFPNGYELELEWPSIYLTLFPTATEMTDFQTIPQSEVIQQQDIVLSDDTNQLLKEVNQILDIFTDADEENAEFQFVYNSIEDNSFRPDPAEITENDKVSNADSTCLLLTGEKISVRNLQESEKYFEDLTRKARNVKWKVSIPSKLE